MHWIQKSEQYHPLHQPITSSFLCHAPSLIYLFQCTFQMLFVCTVSNINFVCISSPMSTVKSDVTCWLFVDFNGSVALPVLLLVNIENPYRLSKYSVSIISISWFLKLVNIVFQSDHNNRVEWAMLKETVTTSPIRCFDQAFLNS